MNRTSDVLRAIVCVGLTTAASLAAVLASPRFANAALPPQVNAAFFLSTSPFMMAKGEGWVRRAGIRRLGAGARPAGDPDDD